MTLTVTDDDGATDSVTQDVVVAVQPPPDPGVGVIPLPPPAPVVMTPAPSARPSVAVKVKARSGKSKLYVNVNPNKGSGYWTFKVQRNGGRRLVEDPEDLQDQGHKETRTLNFKKGTYRVVVKAKYGYQGTTSAEVYLKK